MSFTDLVAVAHDQHGLFTRLQARSLGIDRNRLRRMVKNGQIEPMSPRVFRFTGTPPSRYVPALTGVLDTGTGAVASHLTAARLWGVDNLPAWPVHVTIPRTDHVRQVSTALIHQATHLPEELVTVTYDVPVVVPALAVMQVAASSPGRTAHVLDTLWSKRVLDMAEMADLHDRFSRQGNTGIKLVRRLIKFRSDDQRPADSGNERRFEQIMWRAGIRSLRRQVDVGGGAWVGRVDYLDTDVPLVVEIHSERYHASFSARQADAERIAKLEAAGFTVVVVWDHEIWGDAEAVVARVRKARNRLLRTKARHG